MLFQLILAPVFLLLVSIFPFLSHPLSMGVTLLVTTIMITLMVGVFHSSLWMSYITILILLGGLLVIFIYVSLLASNELFIKSKWLSLPFLLSAYMGFKMFQINPYMSEVPLASKNYNFNETNKNYLDWLTDFYSTELSNLTLFLMFYLLLTLLVVVYNTKNNHGTLRSSS